MMPLVSIVITSYNRAKYIGQAIESALAQDYVNLEVVISDNASTDDTDVVVSRYLQDARVVYHKNERNIGMEANFRKATQEIARGQYITFVSSDDYLCDPTFVSTCVEIIQSQDGVVIVFAEFNILSEASSSLARVSMEGFGGQRVVCGRDAFLKFPEHQILGFGGALMDRAQLCSVNPFDKPGASDWTANLKLLSLGSAGFIYRPCYVWRVHQGQVSADCSLDGVLSNLDYISDCYHFALERTAWPRDELAQWRDRLLLGDIKTCSLRVLYRSKANYSRFMSAIYDLYPDVYTRLHRSLSWRVLRILYQWPWLTRLVYRVLRPSQYELLFRSP